jgi:hypothetical protein
MLMAQKPVSLCKQWLNSVNRSTNDQTLQSDPMCVELEYVL